jgi:hypothetical protein
MQHRLNKPIFIVGAPRSGTSILAWCLGQHPNILPQEESNWLGAFSYFELNRSALLKIDFGTVYRLIAAV